MVTYVYNPSTKEAEAVESGLLGQAVEVAYKKTARHGGTCL